MKQGGIFAEGVKSIGFFGLGRSNIAIMDILPRGKYRITLRSEHTVSKGLCPGGARIYEGKAAFRDIDEDVLILSPSVRRDRPELAEADSRGVVMTSDAELFFERCTSPLFCVTGSDGKSTTATLVHMLLKRKEPTAALVGNIGVPMLPHLLTHGARLYTAELSSFMLTYSAPVSQRAAITNITPNHLNWHDGIEEYRSAKFRILENAAEAVINADDEASGEYLKDHTVYAVTSTELSYGALARRYSAGLYLTCEDGCIKRNGTPLIALSDVRRKEGHNLKNLMTAIAMTDGYADNEDILSVAQSFGGLAHRAEIFYTADGVDFINSSIDTTPARTEITLRSLGKRVCIILGGRGKGLSYSSLREPLDTYAVRIIATGEDGEKIRRETGREDAMLIPDFREAVEYAIEAAKGCDALLLSPAATSYDAFGSFEERGEYFKKIIADHFGF